MYFQPSKYQKEINLVGELVFLNLFFLTGYFFTFNNLITLLQSKYFELQLFFNIAWIISAFIIQVHDTTRTTPFEIHLRRLINALGLYLILIFAFIGIKGQEYYKIFVFQSYFLTALGLTIFHFGFVLFMKYWRRIGYNHRKVVIVGYGQLARELRKFFIFHPEHGYKFLGYFDDLFSGNQIRGKIDEVEQFIKQQKVDEIYCCLPDVDPEKVQRLIEFAEDHFIPMKIIPDFRGFPYKSVEVQLYDYIPVLKLRPQPLDESFNRFMKRSFDIVFSLLVMILFLWWLIPLITLLIRIESNGPAVFKQMRHGKGNEPFVCYKFRTMVINKDADIIQATRNDPRITKIGRFLRRTSLDEIPQFYNVLRGEMSVIGPRPHPLKLNMDYKPQIDKFMLRHSVKPGITGLAQAKGYRGATLSLISMKNRVKLDKFYVENWSLWFDIKIIFLTLNLILRGNDNAY
jgi:putative colanic acid biosysnthesis UDP-glucose lipid carrier transferase